MPFIFFMRILKATLLLLLLLYTSFSYAIDLSTRPDIQQYIQTISQKYGFDQAELASLFNQINFRESTLAKIKPSAQTKPKPYYAYRDALITPKRVDDGVAYWQQHQETLQKAEKIYGVPATLLIGILGVETGYGKNIGSHSALQGLTTLAFNHPTRRPYFTSELTEFLLLCRDQGWDPRQVISSFDGGLGLPQFMPSSYRYYAVSSEQGRQPDLFNNDEDVIFSMANYLSKKGWRPEQPIVAKAKMLKNRKNLDIETDSKPRFTLVELKSQYGLAPANAATPQDLKAGILALETKQTLEHWLAFHNFSVIKKYNNSTNYAMTVYQLGNVISAEAKKRDT